ncbi:HD superfamily hydrolase [Ochrobactrum phage vB_OspM_OC]|nr:HD superfamily hydrolase [Ochrobactrum phage vB_OspM_OC]
MTNERKGDWMQTATGGKYWPIDPRPEEVSIEDIAHALSLMCRFNGHCNEFYSVAEHSYYVSLLVPPEYALEALLHDASEAYIADIVRPAKRFIDGYVDIEDRNMKAISERFGLNYPMSPEVKRADTILLATEAKQIMVKEPDDWKLAEEAHLTLKIQCLGPKEAEELFLERFNELTQHTNE